MARHWKIALAILGAFSVIGLLTLPSLLRSVLRLQSATTAEEQARRAITQSNIATPSDVLRKAHLFWASPSSPGTLAPRDVELSLSSDPVQRSRQLLIALIAQAPSAGQRTIPADTQLLAFYILPGGVAIADFSETLGTATPSGILSEQMTVDSIVQTLAANVPAIHSLKILIHGQEADTLAGHLDLSVFFPVTPVSSASIPSGSTIAAPAPPAPAANSAPPAAAAPATQ